MHLLTRLCTVLALAAAPLVHAATPAFAEKPIRIVVPFPAGGAVDAVARIVANHLAHAWSAQVIVDNRSGAGGAIGVEAVAHAPATGNDLLLGPIGPLTINPALYPRLPYDTQKDLEPITSIAGTPAVLVVQPSMKVDSVQDFVALLKSRPGQLNFGSAGSGNLTHLTAEYFLSTVGARANRNGRKAVGLNENLAREIMELHTLGVHSGYTQTDVTEFARAMTGWTVTGIGRGGLPKPLTDPLPVGSFVFAPTLHEPGTRTILGKSYDQQGEDQARAVLTDFARSPATARHIATKLARHIVADDPPPALVNRLAKAYLSSNGDLPTVYRALIKSKEAWAPAPAKFRDPWNWSIAMYRALGSDRSDTFAKAPDRNLVGAFVDLGQPIWRPGSPAGFDDIAASWAAPDALLRRVELASRVAAQAPATVDPRALAAHLYGPALSPGTAATIASAESPRVGLSLMLVSPEMLRC